MQPPTHTSNINDFVATLTAVAVGQATVAAQQEQRVIAEDQRMTLLWEHHTDPDFVTEYNPTQAEQNALNALDMIVDQRIGMQVIYSAEPPRLGGGTWAEIQYPVAVVGGYAQRINVGTATVNGVVLSFAHPLDKQNMLFLSNFYQANHDQNPNVTILGKDSTGKSIEAPQLLTDPDITALIQGKYPIYADFLGVADESTKASREKIAPGWAYNDQATLYLLGKQQQQPDTISSDPTTLPQDHFITSNYIWLVIG